MPRTLYARLALALLGMFLVLAFSFVVILVGVLHDDQREVTQTLNRDLAAHIVAEGITESGDALVSTRTEDFFHHLMVINPSIEVYLLDQTGRILSFSAPRGHVRRQRVDIEPIRRFLAGGAHGVVLGDDPRGDGQKIFSAAQIWHRGRPDGYLYVVLEGERSDDGLRSQFDSGVYRLALAGGLVSLLFCFASGLLLFRWLTLPLHRLTHAVRTFREREFKGPITLAASVSASEELRDLAAAVVAMADRIVQQLAQLAATDGLRRQAIASVSHDLRTPLAAMQGYIETLLAMDDAIEPEQRREYLRIAQAHGARLGRMIGQMFELAKLDTPEAGLNPEWFSLADLLGDVAQKYQIPFERRGVVLLTDVDQAVPAVMADLGLMERVLDNLVDNALRHTPQGGHVRIQLGRDQDRNAFVVLEDSGSGIPEELIPTLFDRHRRSHLPRRRESSGLGLPIVKRILELHGTTITVSNIPGGGCRFRFHLRLPLPHA